MKVEFLSFKRYEQQRKGLHLVFHVDAAAYTAALKEHGDSKMYHICLINKDSWFLDIKDSLEGAKLGHHNTVFLLLRHAGAYKRAIVHAFFKRFYSFDKYITDKEHKRVHNCFVVDDNGERELYESLIEQVASANIARDMATEPANKLYPAAFCDRVVELFRGKKNVNVKVFGMAKMRELGLNLVVGVGVSAKHEPRFLIIELKCGRRGAETICLCGKGVVFDAGGYDIKTSGSMVHMKGDKTGGAVVVGILHNLCGLKLKHNVVGIVPLVENMVSHKAHKPGDIVTAYNGKTVELLNMDAEGRLILADALAYACQKYKPAWIFDFATLTGWASALHCDTSYVFFTTNDNIASSIQKLGNKVGERSIRLPNWPEYAKYARGNIGDFKNANYKCQKGGGFMATMFLLNFVDKPYRDKWVHFDITHSHNGQGLHNCNSILTGIELIKKLAIGG